MKKLTLITTLVLSLILSACGSTTRGPQAGSTSSNGAMPMATKLIIGTFKLDGTEQDVTAEQAAELLPMWQVYSGLLTSDRAAQAEKDGLINQIQETMTDAQMKAIDDMNLSQQDVMALMQEKGLGMGMGGGQALSTDQIATAQALRQSNSGGGGFAGGPPDGGGGEGGFAGGPPDGGGLPGGGGPSGNQPSGGSNTNSSAAARGPMGGGVPSALIDALIEFLQSKAGL